MTISVIHADSREALRDIQDASVDSCVCDPPYALVSIVKRFGGANAAPAKDRDGLYKRASAGFMGKQWDTGDTAFDPAFWVEVLRVLKPGAHLVAFGGTRTFHRLVCAIEDAGFEVRDQLAWLFGSGFPKSHDVSKGIDRAGAAPLAWFGAWLRTERGRIGMSQKELAERGGFFDKVNRGGLVANWELGYGTPSAAQFNKVCEILELPFERIEEVEREVIGQRRVNKGVAFTSDGPDTLDITAPATDAARQWQGWGTALKPAHEPICLARKPLIGTVASNVLAHGTGALNIDASRIEAEADRRMCGKTNSSGQTSIVLGAREETHTEQGRWPANVIHDGSEEVLRHFPESEAGAPRDDRGGGGIWTAGTGVPCGPQYGDNGSAARFFYTAKADAEDRLGSKHPTVKPVDLMAYLVKLVTPPGGLVLDPFAGSGTTGMACMREGFRAVLIEREAEYVEDIKRRLAHVKGEDAPLFAGLSA